MARDRYISYPYSNLLIAYSAKVDIKPNTCSSWSKFQLGHEWFSHDYYFLPDIWIWKIFHYLITIKTSNREKIPWYRETGRKRSKPGVSRQYRESWLHDSMPCEVGHFLRNYNYCCLVSMSALSLHSLYGYIKITLCSGTALALFEWWGGGSVSEILLTNFKR